MVKEMNVKVDYELKEHLSTLREFKNGRSTIEVNVISFGGQEPKMDIRKWDRETNRMQKGITLSMNEAASLRNVLNDYFRRECAAEHGQGK